MRTLGKFVHPYIRVIFASQGRLDLEQKGYKREPKAGIQVKLELERQVDERYLCNARSNTKKLYPDYNLFLPCSNFAQVSRRVTDRLKISAPADELSSTQK